MIDPITNLRTLPEGNSDADLLREIIGFTAQRLMDLEVEGKTGADTLFGLLRSTRPISRVTFGQPCWRALFGVRPSASLQGARFAFLSG
jgi:hypothetical protein